MDKKSLQLDRFKEYLDKAERNEKSLSNLVAERTLNKKLGKSTGFQDAQIESLYSDTKNDLKNLDRLIYEYQSQPDLHSIIN